MAEITEAEARRICEAVGKSGDDFMTKPRADWPGVGGRAYDHLPVVSVPLWRIVQRAAAGGDNDA